MDSPPRNDEWMPLVTQQLRLRHLIRIIGLNIQCRDGCKLYFTLHHKLNYPPFYKSADIQHYGNSEVILWDDITSSEIYKSNSRAVCVRVWENSFNPQDEEDRNLFTWCVCFSGLILTGSCVDAKYFANTLVFQLNANCFTSPEHFSSFSLENNDYLYDNLYDFDHNAIKIHNTEQRELSDGSGTREITQSDSSSNTKSRSADSSSDWCGGIRCISAQRLKSSTRQSYNLEKLLRIQKIQRSCKRLKQDLHEITEQIIHQNLRHKSDKRRTIDYLFGDIDQTSPQARLESKELSKKIEQLRFKCSLLEREHELCRVRNQELKNQLQSKKDSRNNRCVALCENHSRLSTDKTVLCKRIKVILSGVKTKKDIDQKVHKRLSLLCSELKHIYPINKNVRGCFTVSNIPFPDKDYLSSNPLHTDHMKLMSPAALSVTLGFVAHLVQITAIILDKPLRFSLQSKPSIPPKQILYGIYLLNQNIAQLNYDIFQLRLDPRATIENFLKLFCRIIRLGEEDDEDDDEETVDGDISILDDVDRIEDFQKARTSMDGSGVQAERMQMRKPSVTEDKRYHSEDDLKALVERCLKHSYSHERLDKD